MPEIEALEKGDAARWNREGRLAAWVMEMLPQYIALGVAWGAGTLFSKDASLPDLPSWDKLLESLPDYMRPPSDG